MGSRKRKKKKKKNQTPEQKEPPVTPPPDVSSMPYEPAPRYNVAMFVSEGDDMEPLGLIRDLSSSGVFVETAMRPPVDDERQLNLVWGEDTYQSRVRVVRHADDGIGLTFVEPDHAFKHAITEITSDADPKNRPN